jgi:hypothetical protein
MAGWVPRIASSIAYGIGDKAEVSSDKKLQFEIGRADITITGYDFVTNKLIFKAPLPDDYDGKIHEVGLFSMEKNALAGNGDSRLISTFDSSTEEWINVATGLGATFDGSNTRVGDDSLRLSAAASGTSSAILDGIGLDLSENTSADRFTIAANVSANVSSLKLDLMTETTDYYTLTFAPTAGYRFMSAPMSAAVATGSPSWDSINMIQLRLVATAGGTATVDLDGLRLEDTDTPNPEYIMVGRELLVAPFTKEAGRSQAIEFAIDVSVT